jgi:hypothetical protein
MSRGFRGFAWLLISLSAWPVAAFGQGAGGEVTFPNQVQMGNIFTQGEKVEIEAAIASGATVDWVVDDYAGQQVDGGTAMVADHQVRIAPRITDKGYYSIFFTSKNGGAAVGEGRTSCAVLAPVDITQIPDSKFGIMTHFAQNMPVEFLPLLAKAGIVSVRDEQSWGAVEKSKGVYDFPPVLQAYMDDLKQVHIWPLIVLAFGNPLYDNQPNVPIYKLAPYTPAGFAGYADYCVAVLNHYGQQIKTVAIWNEYNGTFAAGKAATDRPKYYTEMLKEAYTRIKAVRPDVTVLGGAAVKIPLPYFEKLFKLGALNYMDAIDIHPYETPETAEKELAGLVALTKKYNNGQSKPIWATEYSYFGDDTPERAKPANHMVRMSTLLQTQPEVQRMYWYLSRDYLQQFHNLGLIHDENNPMGKYTPVIGYAAYSNLIHQFYHARFEKRVATDSRTRVYQFERGGESLWVCWSTFEQAQLTFTASGPVSLVNIVGGEKQLTPVNGVISVTVGDTPFYVVADRSTVSAVADVPREDEVIADSTRDFSGQQGQGNWTYGYFASNRDGSAPYDPAGVQPMKWEPSPGDWGDTWAAPGRYFSLSEGGSSPSVINGGQGWTVLRWTSDRSGVVHIVGKVERGTGGDGVAVKVFLDGQELFSKMILPNAHAEIDLSPTVNKGSRVDFITTPGPGMDASFDATGYAVTILTPQK